MADIYRDKGDHQQAEFYLKKVDKIEGVISEHARAAFKGEKITTLFNDAVRTYKNGDSEKAEKMFEHVLDVNPSFSPAHKALGEIYIEQNRLAQAMLSIPATKGFEIGSGFAGTRMQGSEHNDAFIKKGTGLGTATNYSGGVQGGISNGEPIVFRTAFKPPATIGVPQETASFEGEPAVLEAKGRHDPCVVPRAVPIVESMAALVLLDLALRQKTRNA